MRDGLLFVLSGGVTRIMREAYPATMGTCLALVVELDRIEAERPHRLEIVVVGEDGEDVARMEAEVTVESSAAAKPAEAIQMPFAVDLRAAVVGRPGAYEIRIYVDGQHQRTLQFWSELVANGTTLL